MIKFSLKCDNGHSFEAWFRAVAALAAHLQGLGVTKGDRVALAMRNLPEWPVAFFAAVSIGAVCVPLNAWWTGPELEYGIVDSGASIVIVDVERYERIRGLGSFFEKAADNAKAPVTDEKTQSRAKADGKITVKSPARPMHGMKRPSQTTV